MRSHEDVLTSLVRGQVWLMDSLHAVRDLHLPDWYIAAGAIRNTVWNVLHGYPGNLHLKDVDVAYFDSTDLAPERDLKFWKYLCGVVPEMNWNVINQARGHILNEGRAKAISSCDSIGYWSETAACVGVRLEQDDSLSICAPYGLNDLFGLIVRPIPPPKQDMELYSRRIREKRWEQTWLGLKIFNG